MSAQEMAGDEISWLADKHFQYFSQLAATAAARFRRPDAGEWLGKLDSAIDDLHAALDRAIADGRPEALTMAVDLSFFWQFRWLSGDGIERLVAALEIEGTDPIARAKGLAAISRLRLAQMDVEEAREAAEAALKIARSTEDRRAQFFALFALAMAKNQYTFAPDLEEIREAGKIAEELGDEALIASSMAEEGLYLLLGGDDHGRRLNEDALAIARRVGDRPSIAIRLDVLGYIASETGNLEIALAYNDEARQITGELGFKDRHLWVNFTRVKMLLWAADPRGAYKLAQEALGLVQQAPNPGELVVCLDYLARSSFDLGNLAEAKLHAERAVEIARRVESPLSLWAYVEMSKILLAEGQPSKAVEMTKEAVEMTRRLAQSDLLAEDLAFHSHTLAQAGMFKEAHAALDEGRKLIEDHGSPPSKWSQLPIDEARLLELEGRIDEAEEKYLAIEEKGVLIETSEALIAVSRIRRTRSDLQGAASALARGVRLMSETGHRFDLLLAFEEGAAVLAASKKNEEAIEVLAWAEALRAQTGVVVPPKQVQLLEALRTDLGITTELPPVAITGDVTADFKEATDILHGALVD